MSIHTEYELKVTDPQKKKPTNEVISKIECYKKLGKWVRKYGTINREEDLYEEKIIDPDTKEVIHHTKEKLSDHKGHGSAKKSKHQI